MIDIHVCLVQDKAGRVHFNVHCYFHHYLLNNVFIVYKLTSQRYQSVANWYKLVAMLICIIYILNNNCHEQVNLYQQHKLILSMNKTAIGTQVIITCYLSTIMIDEEFCLYTFPC